MARYIKKEIADLNGTGNTQAYYRMEIEHNVDYQEFLSLCVQHGGFQRSVIVGAVEHVCHELALALAGGHSVTIDGLGTFTPKVGVRPDKEQDTFAQGEEQRNAQTLEVSGINFRADKELVHTVDSHCLLERGGTSRLRHSQYTEQQRIEIARQYLQEHTVMRTADYVRLTGLSYTTASRELCRIADDPATDIVAHGRKSAKLYMLAE